jgi:hypothetical protein
MAIVQKIKAVDGQLQRLDGAPGQAKIQLGIGGESGVRELVDRPQSRVEFDTVEQRHL